MKLTKNELTFLAKEFETKSDISLFSNIKADCDGTEEKKLKEKGIYANGKLSSEASELLGTAAKANACAKLVIRDRYCFLEKYVYKDHDNYVLVENAGGEMAFSKIENFSMLISETSQFTGNSVIKSTDISIELKPDELLVLLAVADIYRRNALLAFANGEKIDNKLEEKDIVSFLKKPYPNSFMQMLVKNYEYRIPEEKSVKLLLEQLSEKGCIKIEGGYFLTSEYAAFAGNFLIPDTVIMAEQYIIDDNKQLTASNSLFISAGVKDIASIAFGLDEVKFFSISGDELMDILLSFLSCSLQEES